ncbi:alpha-L-rhamnosidase C-terminal domain-containing protein [Streptomyces sioyaensis]|uniref:alpha-L-rhamnosidase-related protein n=1 Tax=Streptomyces sioyaensis TaxID=67364 RepID=UPI0033C1D963
MIVPFTRWQRYGDVQVVRDHYDEMAAWINGLEAHSSGLIRPAGGYGDWLDVQDGTPLELIGTAYFAESTAMMAQMARALGKTYDVLRHLALWSEIREAFRTRFIGADGRIGNGSQTSYVLALGFHLVPDGLVGAAADKLAAGIKAHGGRLTTGFLDTGGLLPMLTAAGHPDVAYQLLEQKTVPSWGSQIGNGATTIWARGAGMRTDGVPNGPALNSLDHFGLGAVGDWIHRTVGGIDPDPAHPGYQHFFLRPVPGPGPHAVPSRADERYLAPYGQVRSCWERSVGTFVLRATVPRNATATVFVPASSRNAVSAPPGARCVRTGGGAAVYEVGSGSYTFTAYCNIPARYGTF